MVISTTAGYAFSKLQFRGRELSFAAVILFLAVPGTALIVPVFHITSQLGLFNNYLGVALPEAALTIPFGVLLMRNYGRNIDDSLIEAAKLDGAGHFRVFWHVFLPLARPVDREPRRPVLHLVAAGLPVALDAVHQPDTHHRCPGCRVVLQRARPQPRGLRPVQRQPRPARHPRRHCSSCSASASSSTASPPAAPKTDRLTPWRTHTMTTITDVEVVDVRFPTSLTADGSDAMNKDGDYSAAYVILRYR